MRSMEDKKLCYQETSSPGLVFEFNSQKGVVNGNLAGANNVPARTGHRSAALGKVSAPSKWDDAQKWLVGLSRGSSGEKMGQSRVTKPRNSNADDLRLIAPVPHKEQDDDDEYYSSEQEEESGRMAAKTGSSKHHHHHEAEKTKTVDTNAEAVWRVNRASPGPATVVRSVCVRDMGTEMTPIASQEPSRTATPVRARTPVARSPVASGSTTPVRTLTTSQVSSSPLPASCGPAARGNTTGSSQAENGNGNGGNLNPLELRAVAWDEAERAKYMARYKREEVKIQAWENHEKRKAEMEMKKLEANAERMKARAEEKMANKLAATRRIAEEKRANAEAKLNEKGMMTSERADYIRRTGHLPSSFSFRLPSLCW